MTDVNCGRRLVYVDWKPGPLCSLRDSSERLEGIILKSRVERLETLYMEVRYEIVHEPQFDEQMARIMGSMERGDAFLRPIEWDLARGVERGCPRADNVWRLETQDGGLESVRIDYVRDDVTGESTFYRYEASR